MSLFLALFAFELSSNNWICPDSDNKCEWRIWSCRGLMALFCADVWHAQSPWRDAMMIPSAATPVEFRSLTAHALSGTLGDTNSLWTKDRFFPLYLRYCKGGYYPLALNLVFTTRVRFVKGPQYWSQKGMNGGWVVGGEAERGRKTRGGERVSVAIVPHC